MVNLLGLAVSDELCYNFHFFLIVTLLNAACSFDKYRQIYEGSEERGEFLIRIVRRISIEIILNVCAIAILRSQYRQIKATKSWTEVAYLLLVANPARILWSLFVTGWIALFAVIYYLVTVMVRRRRGDLGDDEMSDETEIVFHAVLAAAIILL